MLFFMLCMLFGRCWRVQRWGGSSSSPHGGFLGCCSKGNRAWDAKCSATPRRHPKACVCRVVRTNLGGPLYSVVFFFTTRLVSVHLAPWLWWRLCHRSCVPTDKPLFFSRLSTSCFQILRDSFPESSTVHVRYQPRFSICLVAASREPLRVALLWFPASRACVRAHSAAQTFACSRCHKSALVFLLVEQ